MHALTKLLAVASVDASTVDDSSRPCNFGRDLLAEEGANVCMSLLCLGRSCDLAGTNGPHRLIGNDNFAADVSGAALLR